MQYKTSVALALVVAWGLTLPRASAQTPAAAAPARAASAEPATPLSAITNTATRTDRRVDEVPVTVTVLPAAAIEDG